MKYEVKRSLKARSMRLTVHPDARVVVTAPYFLGAQSIGRFVRNHARWVERRVDAAKNVRVVRLRRGEIPVLKKRAHEYASARCARYAVALGIEFKKISIRAQRKRWGSCSRRGNLSFNYKIAALPEHLAEYIVVHEVCHLTHFNHSRDFWNLVALFIPDHHARRKELRSTAFVFY